MPSRTLARAVLPLALAGLVGAANAQTTAPATPAHTPDANAPRASVPDLYKWNLAPLFASDEAWEAERAKLESRVAELATFKGRLSDPKVLESCLDAYFDVHNAVNNITLYGQLRLTTAQTDTAAQAMADRGQILMSTLMDTSKFIRAEVLALDEAKLAKAYKKVPGLAKHQPYIDGLRRRKAHTLGEEGEQVLALAGDNLFAEIDLNEIISTSEKTFNAMLSDMPLPKVHNDKGEEVQLTLSSYPRFRTSPNREVRKEAVGKFLGTLRQYQHVFASTLAGQDQYDVLYAQARKYPTAMEAYLDKDEIDPQVYKNLVDTVHANLTPLHRYVALRKKALGVPDVHLYDLYVPLVPGVESTVSFDQARTLIHDGLAPLGEDYLKILDEGLDPKNGWLDLYPHADKESGAFAAGVYGKHPYVMMNYFDSSDDMSTLAHEYGHAVHTWLSSQNQPYATWRYVPFLAEIASTANETLLADHLLANTRDNAMKAYLLAERLETIRGTIYRQTLFAEFDWKVHRLIEEGTPITAELLTKTYGDLVRQYYGPEYVMDENDAMEWAYIPHFYYKYYVFVYATGLSSGIAIAERLKKEGAPARDAYLTMLKAGSSAPPLDLLREAGVDLTRPDAIKSALDLFDRTVTELEALLPEIQPPAAPAVPATPAKPAKGKKKK